MIFTFHSKNYPGAPDLTTRSENIGFLTSTMMSLIYMCLICAGIVGFMVLLGGGNFPESAIGVVGTIVGFLSLLVPLGMRILRKRLFQKLDEEYAKRNSNRG